MGELFDLLQGHVERWDGLRDQTLSNEERRKTGKSADCQHISSRTYILPCLIPSLVLKLPQILSTLDIIRRSSHFIFNATCFICASEHFLRRTSGGVFVGGVVSEALEEALEGDGLIDSFESLSASLAPLPFTWKHKRSSASLLSEKNHQIHKKPHEHFARKTELRESHISTNDIGEVSFFFSSCGAVPDHTTRGQPCI